VATGQPPHDLERRIPGIGRTEHELQRLVLEPKEGDEVSFQVVVGTAKRLEDRNAGRHRAVHRRRRGACRREPMPGGPAGDQQPGQCVEPEAGRTAGDEKNSRSVHAAVLCRCQSRCGCAARAG
jgi:hypothetical protein